MEPSAILDSIYPFKNNRRIMEANFKLPVSRISQWANESGKDQHKFIKFIR